MSKMITVLHRRPCDEARARHRVREILEAITPDLVDDARYDVRCEGGHLLGVMDLPDHMPRDGMSLCQGKLYDSHGTWSRPGSGHPDGSYALVRADAATLEVLTDPAASRTVWYYFDDDVFVASNAQRAVTMYAGRFEADRSAALWALSSGGPGPDRSYNGALKLLPAEAVIRLDRAAWTMRVEAAEVRFEETGETKEAYLATMETAVREVLATFDDTDARSSVISLSGGNDSRLIAAILRGLAPERRWRSFTGGAVADLNDPGSDAAIGTAVAAALDLDHRLVSPAATEPPADVVRRFVLCGEGRIDHLTGYLDGMRHFDDLRRRGEVVNIRGDVAMGWLPLPSAFAIRQKLGLLTCAEIASLAPRLADFGFEGHSLPDHCRIRQGETLDTWRDRLVQTVGSTSYLSPLNELKTGFIDVVNPLLSRRMLVLARRMPDDLRNGKSLYRELVKRTGPDLPLAHDDSDGPQRMYGFLMSPEVRALFVAGLRSGTAHDLYGAAFARWLARDVERRMSLGFRVQHAVTRRFARRKKSAEYQVVDAVRLAFRAHMAITMVDQLRADAGRFASEAPLAIRAA